MHIPARGFTLLLLCGLAVTGCALPATVVLTAAAPVAQAGTAAYINNEMVFVFNLPIADVRLAVVSASQALDLSPGSELATITSDGRTKKIYIPAETRDGVTVEIRLEAVTQVLTRIRVRFGFWGDQAVSRAILTKIERALGQEHPNGVFGTAW